MSDAAYFSAFSEPPLETYARRLKNIDRKGKKKKRKKNGEREREREQQGSKFYYTAGQNLFRHAILKKRWSTLQNMCESLFWKWRKIIFNENLTDINRISNLRPQLIPKLR